jgi:hypothetical protein
MTDEFKNCIARKAVAWLERESIGAGWFKLHTWHFNCRLSIEKVAVWPFEISPEQMDEVNSRVVFLWKAFRRGEFETTLAFL